MKHLLTLLLTLAIASSAAALELGNSSPIKPDIASPTNTPNPVRQGGDTIENATPIPIIYAGVGTTTGYTDDYDGECPFFGVNAPDVVYLLTPEMDITVDIDMLGSQYDTKINVWDVDMNMIACNDDFYPDYVSKIEELFLPGGEIYYLVIDGYGGQHGDYVLTISEAVPCILECPVGAELEGEPPLVDGYVDEYNGGCATESGGVMQPLNAGMFCGRSGYYTVDGGAMRDTDWFLLTIGDQGFLEITGDAEEASYMFELGPQECADVAVIQNVPIGPCLEATMTIVGEPGATVWFWVGSQSFWDGDTYEYDYVLTINDGVTAIEHHSLTEVKALFQ